MRQANHIILDFENSNNIQNSKYWVNNFILENNSQPLFIKQVTIHEITNLSQPRFNDTQPITINNELIYNSLQTSRFHNKRLNTVLNLININFLRKEKLYTKLKYSRSPAYDIVSGGAAALFAGFLGFLVSEKFGFELVDSGDFYFLTMYIVFLCFSVRPLLTTIEPTNSVWEALSLRNVISFYTNIISLLIRFFK